MSLTLFRILHAGYVFACGDTRIVFDPIFETPFAGNCHAYPDVRFDHARIRRQRFAAVFISHYHDDHCSFSSLDLIARETPIYLYCVHEEMFALIRKLGFTTVHALAIDRPVRVGEFTVTPIRAFDADVDCIFGVSAGAINVLNVVDALIDDDTLAALASVRWDVVLWPFQTMRELAVLAPDRAEPAEPRLPPEFLTQLRALDPRVVVPSSCQFRLEPWSWMNDWFFPVSYARFAREVGEALPHARVLRLDPARALRIDRSPAVYDAASLDWVVPTGGDLVDYAFDPTRTPTPTAELARHFAGLDPEQRARVDAFCRGGLAARYEILGGPANWAAEPVDWRLVVYDHAGHAQTFDYRITGDQMRPLDTAVARPTWITEIVAAKLRAALEDGEALTSLYLRIVRAPPAADVLDDPLVRVLYTGVFAATQKAQLRTLGIDYHA